MATTSKGIKNVGFNLDTYEYYAYRREHERAARELMALMAALDRNYGSVGEEFRAMLSTDMEGSDIDEHLATRAACATAFLFSDPEFRLSPLGTARCLIGSVGLPVCSPAVPCATLIRSCVP